jgi:uncharacterized membrane protein YsdA (DUF1294 family)
MWNAVAVYLGLVAVTSLASLAAYKFDKRRAAAGGRRVPERTLLVLAFVGGWPGAILAQRRFRHKTSKVPFLIAFLLAVQTPARAQGSVMTSRPSAFTGPDKTPKTP